MILMPDDNNDPVSFLDVSQSLKGARWIFPPVQQDVVDRISRMHGLPDFIARMLHLRGVAPEDVPSFLNPTLRDHFPDPFSLVGMQDFANDFAQAIMSQRRIGILADFDVDGATSGAILTRFMRRCGQEPPIYIPDRLTEGYGPSEAALKSLQEQGAEIVLMADCGITAFEPVRLGRAMGLEICIFDHHEAEDGLPDANHIINPKRKDDTSGLSMLAACGVSFLACVAVNTILKKEGFFQKNNLPEPNFKNWIDLVALGTVCDMVPLTGPNRLFVRAGFIQMKQKTNMGIRALCEVSNTESALEPMHAGFVLGPRINAGSRVHRSDLGARLLSTDDLDEARSIAFTLEECNEQRKAIQSDMMKQAMRRVDLEKLHEHPVIVMADAEWHPGLGGLVAGRLKERYNKPAIVITYAKNGDGVLEGRGSGRSVRGVDLAACFIAARNEGIIIKGGGHAMAGGFTIHPDRIPDLQNFLYTHIEHIGVVGDGTPETVIDSIATVRGAQTALVRLLTDHLGPFGIGNEQPVFALANIRIQTADVLKDKHIRLNVTDWEGGGRMKAMLFNGIGTPLGDTLLSDKAQPFHLAGQFHINEWQGRESVEFMISDAAPVMPAVSSKKPARAA